MNIRCGSLPLALLLAGCAHALGRAAAPVRPWETVRVTAPEAGLDRKKGDFLEVRADSLVLVRVRPFEYQGIRMTDTIPWTVPLAAVTRLERRRRMVIGEFVGMVGGFAAGYQLAARVECGEIDPSCLYKGMGVMLLASGAGVLLGHGFQAIVWPESLWEEVPLGDLRQVIAGRRGAGVGSPMASGVEERGAVRP